MKQVVTENKSAPRITPADIEANIASEHYFTAGDGVAGRCYRDLSALHSPRELELLTFCVLVLKNGFTVTGESYCASADRLDPDVGREVARQNAVAKVWPLMGYELKSQLAKGE